MIDMEDLIEKGVKYGKKGCSFCYRKYGVGIGSRELYIWPAISASFEFQIFHNPKMDMTRVESLGIVKLSSLSQHELRLARKNVAIGSSSSTRFCTISAHLNIMDGQPFLTHCTFLFSCTIFIIKKNRIIHPRLY